MRLQNQAPEEKLIELLLLDAERIKLLRWLGQSEVPPGTFLADFLDTLSQDFHRYPKDFWNTLLMKMNG